ncbi:MAG: hypothetical protein O2944_03090, partial [Proteobacteria bacterium]|nr:hypothetical protein [Pseudomonadota bacterium]
DQGMATAVVAPAADMTDLNGQRGSDEFVTDFGNVFAYLRERFKKPVWAHGTSRGSVSIALPVSKIVDPSRRPDGIILSSPVSKRAKLLNSVFDGDLGAITGPALIVAHKNDGCGVTPASGAEQIAAALTKAKPVKVLIMEGGDELAKGDPCKPLSQHGFPGIQQRVIDAMAAFIKNPG